MPNIPQAELPKPKSWDEFEDICWDLYSRFWQDPHADRYGRSGEPQHGVDIVGRPKYLDGGYSGVQCKRYAEGTLTRATIRREVGEADKFTPTLSEYIIATTHPRAVDLQSFVLELNQEREKAGQFPVHLAFWDTLCGLLTNPDYKDILRKHYGEWLTLATAPLPPYKPLPPPDPDTLPDPGDLPPGSRIPFGRNNLFTGREEPLLALARALLHDGTSSTLVTQTVQGMGGIGKTQLAVEFAHRYGRFFHGVHWIASAQPDLIGAEIAACGQLMALSPWPQEQPDQIQRTLRAWRDAGPHLVILDNLEDLEAARQWLPRLQRGSVRLMLTARRSDWPDDLPLALQRLDLFSPDESLAFLRRTLPAARASDAELEALAGRLGHLPLALELAARYLKRLPRLSVPAYLARLDDLFADPAMAGWRPKLGSPTKHDLDLTTTFRLSWELVDDRDARNLFLTAGHCAPNQPIPCELLEKAADLDETGCDEALSILTGLGLLEMDDPDAGPTIHPLLAEYTSTLLGTDEALAALASALGPLTHEATETLLPSSFLPLRPHVEVVAPAAEAATVNIAATLWNNLGYHLNIVADYHGARAAYERALAIDEAVYGPDHPSVATDVNNLGEVLQALGDLAGARAAHERALEISTEAYGDSHPQVATANNNLGRVLHDLGDLAGARAAFERALEIWTEAYGPSHAGVAIANNNLGLVMQDLGDLPGARAAFERALAVDEAAYGPDHPSVARGVNNVGLVLRDLGDLAGAQAAFERAIAINEAAYGPNHPGVAKGVNNLGSVLQAQGDLAGARAAFERTLAIDRRTYGSHHPDVARDINNLGLVLQDLGDLAGARAAFEQAIEIWTEAYGGSHTRVATANGNLGLVLQALGDLPAARAAFERALAIDQAAYGPDHSSVARDINNLGYVLLAQGDLAGARAAFERALAIVEAAYGPDHLEVAIRVNNLGSVLQQLGDLAGARAAFERALEIWTKAFGDNHTRVAIANNNLGLLMKDQGDLVGARAAFERALAVLEKQLGPDHPNVATLVNNMGSVLQDLGDLAGARAAFERALAIDQVVYGAEHPSVELIFYFRGIVLLDWGDLAGARAAFEQALAIFEAFGDPRADIARGNLAALRTKQT